MAAREDDVNEIRRSLEHTRAEMHETIDAIREKLDPQRLKEQAQESIRDATIGRAEDTMSKAMNKAEDAMSNARETAAETGSGILDTIRQNPIPAAMAGIGLGWLMMNRSPAQKSNQGYYGGAQSYYRQRDYDRSGLGSTGRRYYEGYAGSFEDNDEESQGRMSRAAASVGEKAGAIREAASEKMDDIREAASDIVGDVPGEVQERVGSAARQTRYQYDRLEDRFQNTLDTNPLALGAVALAAGAAAALLFPATLQERRIMGEARDSLVERVQETAQDTMEKVQRVAGQAEETVKKEAKEEGLTGL